jgi:hypothetical protein
MNVFIRAMVRIFSFGERWNVPFNDKTFNVLYNSIALLGNGIFYSISRDHKQPIKRSEFNKVLYKINWWLPA